MTPQSMTRALPAILAQGIEKSYDDLPVLRGVDLEVAPGTIVALLGSNGAGKTTLVNILSTLLRADAGTASVAGFDVARQSAACAGRSASPDSSPPWMRSSPGARTWSWLPGSGTSRAPAGSLRSCSTASSWPRQEGAVSRHTPGACVAVSISR